MQFKLWVVLRGVTLMLAPGVIAALLIDTTPLRVNSIPMGFALGVFCVVCYATLDAIIPKGRLRQSRGFPVIPKGTSGGDTDSVR